MTLKYIIHRHILMIMFFIFSYTENAHAELYYFGSGLLILDIPSEYIWIGPKNSSDPHQIVLRAQLPDLLPKGPTNAPMFLPQDRRSHLLIAFVSYKEPALSGDEVLSAFKNSLDDKFIVAGRYKIFLVKDNQNIIFYQDAEGKEPKYFICNKNVGYYYNITSTCEIKEPIRPDIFPKDKSGRYPLYVSYSIPASYVGQLREIDARVSRLLSSFEKSH